MTGAVKLNSSGGGSVQLDTPATAANLVVTLPGSSGTLVTGAADAVYTPAGTGAVATTVQAKLRESVSVKDFGADPSASATVNTAAFNAAIAAASDIFIPAGTYLIDGPIYIGTSTVGNKHLYGEGARSTVILGTTADSGIQNKVSHFWVKMENFSFNGGDVATVGVSLGIPSGATGSSAYDFLHSVHIIDCVTIGLELNSIQYCKFENCQINGVSAGHGVKATRFLTSEFDTVTIMNCQYGMYLGNYGGANSSCANIYFRHVDFFGPNVGTSPDWYLGIDGAYGVYFTECTFENERVFNNPLVIINNTDAALVTANIYFNECLWHGLPYANDLIQIQTGVGTSPTRIFFQSCRAIRPSPGNYILNTAGSAVFITDCFATTGYYDSATLYWSDGGFVTGTVTEDRSSGVVYFKDETNGFAGINTTTPQAPLDVKPTFTTAGVLQDIQYLYGTTNYSTRGGFRFVGTAATNALNRRLSFDHYAQTEFRIQTINTDGTAATDCDLKLQPLGGTTRCGGQLIPEADNVYNLGNPSGFRWATVYAGTGTINTSDGREKQDIQSLDDAEKAVALGLKSLIKKFKFKAAVTLKGNAARIHVGVIAQEVIELFQANGLDANKYALLCLDSWEETNEVVDDEGKVTQPYVPAGYRYGIRYEELLAFIISAL